MLGGLLVFLSGCEHELQYADLVGNWHAFEVTEEGEPLGVDPAVIRLQILPGNRYAFESTLNYREAGHCTIDPPYLYTTDTTATDQEEKVVRILNPIPQDSLFLLMQEEDGSKRTLRMVREE